jgi:signal transduction histidine kinase
MVLGAVAHDVVLKRPGVSIRTDGHAVISGDKSSLTRLMVILLDNAAKYGDGHTELTVVPENGTVTLSVADDGAGIDTEHVDRLFERFYRADPARNSAGYGLGLAIAREVMSAHGGTIIAANRAEGGALFTASFPAGHPPP